MSTNRRVPLSSNPNAANSPYRAVASAAAQKQKRSYATIQREEAYGQAPPAKKQMLEANGLSLRTPPRQPSGQAAEGRVFTRRSNNSQPTAFERKCEVVRVRPTPQQTASRPEKPSEENLETIRQWQKHYRKVFPKYVFYFESIPEETRIKHARQVIMLGAREEKFFSNAVTHVVTTRSIPPEFNVGPTDAVAYSSAEDSHSRGSHPQTINPLLLDRSSEPTAIQGEDNIPKGRFTFDAPMGRRTVSNTQDLDARKHQARNADVLHRARELGMKIWALEKLQRMMYTMFDTDTGVQTTHGHNTRSNPTQMASHAIPRPSNNADLSQLLRNERINGPSDRDPTVATGEMVIFKGPFIYIHDIDEKQRPIMVREYAKVLHKEEGDWPQFRSVANGKCPFVEEIDYGRREAEKEAARQQQQKHIEREKSAVPRTRAAAAEACRMQPPRASNEKSVLAQVVDGSNRGKMSVPISHADPFASRRRSEQEMAPRDQQNMFASRAKEGRLFGGEPVASGVQPSNVTSAIRSQMISSTAAAGPGAKAGTSKEVHGLQRKVLEKNSGPTSLSLTSSHRTTDLIGPKEDGTCRAAKRKAQEKLGFIDEDPSPAELEDARRAEAARKSKAIQKRKSERRDPKPGYCENCMDKFEDFDEKQHILSRKHRKFAERADNWRELDALLRQLERPIKDVDLDTAY
ncbi:MAG: hypothetical protein M1818_003320 [Claussenomyces sp. TS43310]|nr:MAG: hypothetical protein M1818_003320 [Claussenomyces sp. TS43310]